MSASRCPVLPFKVASVFVSFQPQGADSLRHACYPFSVTGASAGMAN